MKKWQAEVWLTTIAGKSKRGNWYEGQFRWFWLAYFIVRVMAKWCDIITPTKIVLEPDYPYQEPTIIESPYGIQWGIKKI